MYRTETAKQRQLLENSRFLRFCQIHSFSDDMPATLEACMKNLNRGKKVILSEKLGPNMYFVGLKEGPTVGREEN